MAEAQANGALGVALVRGKIKAVRRFNGARGGFMNVVVMPAPDEYSMPAGVEIHSPEPLGEVGASWSGKVRIGGVPKSYTAEREDPHTGEVRKVTVQTADNQLFLLL